MPNAPDQIEGSGCLSAATQCTGSPALPTYLRRLNRFNDALTLSDDLEFLRDFPTRRRRRIGLALVQRLEHGYPRMHEEVTASRRQPLSTTAYRSGPVPRLANCRSTGVRGLGVLGPPSSYRVARSRSRPLMKGSFAFAAKSRTIRARCFLNSSSSMANRGAA